MGRSRPPPDAVADLDLFSACKNDARPHQADLAAHAQMLVCVSASSEFLANVQGTSAHPANVSNWLLLI